MFAVTLLPPAMSTLPFISMVAVCSSRLVLTLPDAVHFPVEGLYSSVLLVVTPAAFSPPATTTLPVGNKLAVCSSRAVIILPVNVHLPVAGL